MISRFSIGFAALLAGTLGGLGAGAASEVSGEHWTASAELPPTYGVGKAVDGVASTHWAAPNRPPIWIQARFDAPRWISRIRILQVPDLRLYSNCRRVALALSDGNCYSCVLPDRSEEVTIAFPRARLGWLRMTIESAYRASYYVGIGEITLDDEGAAAGERRDVVVTPAAGALSAQASATSSAGPPGGAIDPGAEGLIGRLAAAPIVSAGHPTLLMNAADVERAKANIRRHAWARHVFRAILDGADRWLAMSDPQLRDIVPRPRALFDSKAACPYCGGACTADLQHVGRVRCSKCARTLPDAQHADDGSGWLDPQSGEKTYFVGLYNNLAVDRITDGAGDLAQAYVLTGDERYAHALSVLLDALAAIYPSCDKGPVWYPGEGGRLNRPFYQTARTLIYYAREYDLSYGSREWDQPSVRGESLSRRANYERNLLGNGAEYCFAEVCPPKALGLHNGNCDYLQGALAVGRVLGIARFIDYALESDLSIFNFLENTIDRDGQYYETSFGYSQWATGLFGHHAEMLRNYRSPKYPHGINLYDHPKLRQNYLNAELDADCAGHQPALGDAGPDLLVIDPENARGLAQRVCDRLEVLAARTGDAALRAEICRRLYAYGGDPERRRGESIEARWLLFHADDLPPAEPAIESAAGPAGSTLLAGGRGIATLRSGSAESGPRCALLRYGATLNHGSPDEMNVNLYALGREIGYDQGYGWAHHRAGWAHATVAHDLVVVDEQNQIQKQDGSGGDLECFCQSPGIRVVAADDPAAYGGEGVTRYRRLLALVDLSPSRSYLLDVFDVQGGRRHDLSHHFAGSLVATEEVGLGAPQTSGSLAGPEYEWWKLIQPSGWLRGQNKPFYWSAPPENGYGFLFDVQQATVRATARAAAPCFVWKLGERPGDRPASAFSPASCTAGCREVTVSQPSAGSYVYRSPQAGGSVAFRVAAGSDGEYLVLVRLLKGADFGRIAATIDGRSLGRPLDAYSPVEYVVDNAALGRIRLSAGPHELRLTCVGKDRESGGYGFGLKYVALEPPAFLERPRPQTEGVALTLVPPEGSRLVTAKAKGLGQAPTSNYVLVRRDGHDLRSRFVSIVEPFVDQRQVLGITAMPGDHGGPSGGNVLIVKSREDRQDWFFDFSPAAGETAMRDSAGRAGRFAGQFAAVRTRAGRPYEILLSAARRLYFAGLEITAADAAYSGKVLAVDYEKGTVTIDAAVPASIASARPLVYFSRATYSRNAPYHVAGVGPGPGGGCLDLGGASLVLARGRATADLRDGVLANGVPLDRERRFGGSGRTRYFDGKAVRNLRTGELGRIKNVNLDASLTIERNPDLRRGDGFELLDVQAGDRWLIPAIVSLSQGDEDRWKITSNVRVRVVFPGVSGVVLQGPGATGHAVAEPHRAAPAGECVFDPAAGASAWEVRLVLAEK